MGAKFFSEKWVLPELKKDASMKVLFLMHELTRSGAPLYLLNFLDWAEVNEPDLQASILLLDRERCELLSEFENYADIFFVKDMNRLDFRGYVENLNIKYDLIYVNSLESFKVIRKFDRPIVPPVIVHVHESSLSISTSYRKRLKKLFRYTDVFLGVSDTVCMAIREYGFNRGKVYKVENFSNPLAKGDGASVRKKYGIAADAFIVGTLTKDADRNKCPERAIETLSFLNDRKFVFVFTGYNDNDRRHQKLRRDIARRGLSSRFYFLPCAENPNDFMDALDVYFITSITESFSLTMLEAGFAKKPVLTFRDNEGPSSFITEDYDGLLASDAAEAARCLLLLEGDRRLRTQLAENLHLRVHAGHRSDICCHRLVELMQKTISSARL